MGWFDRFLDRVEVVINVWSKVWGKVEKVTEPAVKVITPHVDTFVREMDPLMNRPVDWALFMFFTSHIPISILFDLQPLYPEWIIPTFFKQLHGSYMYFLNDPLMDMEVPVKYWFRSFSYCEAFLQLPFFFVAAYGVLRDKSWIRLPIAVYGAHVVTTVIPCLAEIIFNSELYNLSELQRNTLIMLYFPYFLVPFIGMVDSCLRITKALREKDAALVEKKNE